jgi:hypothetical protein
VAAGDLRSGKTISCGCTRCDHPYAAGVLRDVHRHEAILDILGLTGHLIFDDLNRDAVATPHQQIGTLGLYAGRSRSGRSYFLKLGWTERPNRYRHLYRGIAIETTRASGMQMEQDIPSELDDVRGYIEG